MAKKNGELTIQYLPLDDLEPYPNNARTHSDAQIAQIAASIKEFGWTNPILVDGHNGVVAGHGRFLAAKSLGMELVPVIELTGLTATQKRAYILADNKLAENAGWDFDRVAVEFGELQDAGFDVDVIGFDAGEVDAFMAPKHEGLTDPDAVPEAPEMPVTVLGDLWALGRHRVLCGDATVATDVERALGGVEPHLMVTDPPYGVGYDPAWRSNPKAGGKGAVDKRAVGRVSNDDNADWREAWALFPGDVAYVWHADKKGVGVGVGVGLMELGFELRSQIIWGKSNYPMGRGDYHHQHEPCWYAVRKGAVGHYCGGRKQTTLWQIDSPRKSETGHSTQKPVECMRRPIVNNSSPGQAVYDPFLGSSTTVIASEMEGRICLGLEIEPKYVDVGVLRWQEFVGKDATLDGDGRTFNEIAANRSA